MEISMVDRGDWLTPGIESFANTRLLFALSRFDQKIDRVVLTLRDVNGPKGGVDKECKIQIMMHRGKDIIITDIDSEGRACIARAAERAGRTVARRMERLRDTSRMQSLRIAFGEVM